jgi:beta-xylosidase
VAAESRSNHYIRQDDLSGRIRTCGQKKLHAHLFGEERVDVGFEDQWIDNSSMADRDPTLTVDKNGQRYFSQMAWINKRPTTSITTQVTP